MDGTYPIAEHKQCTRCKQSKPLVEFVLSGLSAKLSETCKPCRVEKRARERARFANAVKALGPLPERLGERVLVSRELFDRNVGSRIYKHVRVRCESTPECGDESYVRETLWRNGTAGDRCRRCSARKRNLEYCKTLRRKPRVKVEIVSRMPERMKAFAQTPWSEDVETQRLVAENPNGMTLEQVGTHLGCTRERVRQIEAQALRRLRAAFERAGLGADDFTIDAIRTMLEAQMAPRSTPNRRAA